ncbi:MAG: helix-hairpin-helix domain-containing protein [Deltaproteobacteria bacterium]|nr:MAG: helix-hairpin-helix domain-containing protein [Deltaproteobacteria bacterium]
MPSSTGLIDVNTAGADQLTSLPGIGPTKAAAIVADREQNGPYSSCQDLTRVTGIGSATVTAIAKQCTASGQ